MADFRKWFIVLAMLSLFAGMAAAQAPFTCTNVNQVVPTLRSEGLTELVGDIVLSCTGGAALATGAPIPQANIIVSLTAPVTSRLQSATTNASEALLLIDEPNSPQLAQVPGYGPQAPLSLCTSTTGGCPEVVGTAPVDPALIPGGGSAPVALNPDGSKGFNVFQGIVTGTNQILFAGVPVLPTGTSGVSRVFRITNIRVNANGAGSSIISGIQPVYAYLSTSGSALFPVGNQALTVGFVQTSLAPSATSPTTLFTQCNGQTGAPVALLNYKENFPSAFKTRVAPLTTATGASYLATNAGTAPGTGQNSPGQQQFVSESGFIMPITGSFTAGLADFGTRFRATFANLPAGVSLYVSQNNVTNATTAAPAPLNSQSTTSFATLSAGSEGAAFSNPTNANSTTFGGIPVVKIVDTTTSLNTATAVWEVVNSNSAASETFSFAVYISYTPSGTASALSPSLTPATNGPSVTLSYAPISNVTSASTASAPIPRFVVGANATTQPIITIVPCQTVLLFPYVTTMSGLETGVAISNTALDPLSPATLGSTGSCRLFFYGSNLSSTQILPPTDATQVKTIGPIAPGNPDWTKAAFLASDKFGSNVTGYMFASCDFQYAHGFAFISDAGLRNLAMGYLALVVTNGETINRVGAQKGESLNN